MQGFESYCQVQVMRYKVWLSNFLPERGVLARVPENQATITVMLAPSDSSLLLLSRTREISWCRE